MMLLLLKANFLYCNSITLQMTSSKMTFRGHMNSNHPPSTLLDFDTVSNTMIAIRVSFIKTNESLADEGPVNKQN